jgi:hypothetical protein
MKVSVNIFEGIFWKTLAARVSKIRPRGGYASEPLGL